ncbi:MAG TPA: alpha/beta hydrolase, partial [Clostridia bacterium]
QKSADTIKLIRVPVVMVHGYQENVAVFDTMKDYLNGRGFSADAFGYESVKGVISSVKELDAFLSNKTQEYMKTGTQISKYDVISHSMGGLVARYYSCSSDYLTNDNIRKLIFVSVPHKGTPWAAIGTNYFNDQGVKDLIPDGPFISKILPSTLNKGLNNKIEVGNIAVEFDEVVPSENSSLSEWGINTEVFNIGGNNFTFDNIISGNIIQAPNHKNILSNRKSFEAVEKMLNNDLPYPSVKK